MKLFRYFTQGLLVIVPLAITIIILMKIYSFLNNILIKFNLPADNFLTMAIVIIAVAGGISLIGVFASSFLFSTMFSFMERVLEHTPGIKLVYSPIKDFMQAFV